MKICGCQNCKNAGERNLAEEFELYCSTRELEDNAVFEAIFKASYTLEEMSELYDEMGESFEIAEKIQAYTMKEGE